MIPSAHIDTFPRDNLPPSAQWPDSFLRSQSSSIPTASIARSSCWIAGSKAVMRIGHA